MEWLELLKMLTDQQQNEITQQQIDTLQGQTMRIAEAADKNFMSLQIAIVFVFLLLVANMLIMQIQLWKLDKKITKNNSTSQDS